MNKRIVPVVIGVVVRQGKILLTKRQEWEREDKPEIRKTPWQIPGGGLEFAESTEECAIRELKEEAGIDVQIISLIPQVVHKVYGSWHGLFICYLCRMLNEEQPVVINEEASQWGWYTLEQIKQMPCLPLTYEIAQLALT